MEDLIQGSLEADALKKRGEALVATGGLSNYNFPDPAVIEADGKWYAFATRSIGSAVHVQVAESDDFAQWNLVTNEHGQYDALPNLPSWIYAKGSAVWAPDVVQLDDGSYVMYYAATSAKNQKLHCIGAAKSSSVLGPYTAIGNDPLYCPLSQGGAIDASGFKDPATNERYVVNKVDGNLLGHGGACGNDVAPFAPTPLMLQPVDADGVTPTGSAITLLENAGASDQGIVEAPALAKVGDKYVLFFSSNCFAAGHYTLSYAVANRIAGPYTRASEPLYATGQDGLKSPGGADVHTDGVHMVFHGDFGAGRRLYQAMITMDGNKVVVQ